MVIMYHIVKVFRFQLYKFFLKDLIGSRIVLNFQGCFYFQGCLQYFAGNEGQGTVEAFNFNQPTNAYAGHLSGWYNLINDRSLHQNFSP